MSDTIHTQPPHEERWIPVIDVLRSIGVHPGCISHRLANLKAAGMIKESDLRRYAGKIWVRSDKRYLIEHRRQRSALSKKKEI